jgi:hypothetical protein
MGLVALLGDDELDLAVTPPQMLDLTAANIGSLDADLADLAALNSEAVKAFADGSAAVDGLDALFTPSATLAEVITQDTLAADTALLPGDLKTGDAVLADLDGLFATAATPPTTGSPGSGAGIGGAGSGQGGCGKCRA